MVGRHLVAGAKAVTSTVIATLVGPCLVRTGLVRVKSDGDRRAGSIGLTSESLATRVASGTSIVAADTVHAEFACAGCPCAALASDAEQGDRSACAPGRGSSGCTPDGADTAAATGAACARAAGRNRAAGSACRAAPAGAAGRNCAAASAGRGAAAGAAGRDRATRLAAATRTPCRGCVDDPLGCVRNGSGHVCRTCNIAAGSRGVRAAPRRIRRRTAVDGYQRIAASVASWNASEIGRARVARKARLLVLGCADAPVSHYAAPKSQEDRNEECYRPCIREVLVSHV